jgi:hypothetical protein
MQHFSVAVFDFSQFCIVVLVVGISPLSVTTDTTQSFPKGDKVYVPFE